MSFLNKITGTYVLFAGLIGAAAASWLLPPASRAAVMAICACSALLSWTPVTKFFAKILAGFADAPEWPRFVLLGVAILVAAHAGGWRGCLTIVFLLAAEDGNVFDALY